MKLYNTMTSFCRMSTCWRPLLIRATSSQLSRLPIPKSPSKSATSVNFSNRFICSCTNILFKQDQRHMLLPSFVASKPHRKHLHTTPSFLSFASDGDFQAKRKKKFGFLKTKAKRADWYEGEGLIATMIEEKGEEGWTNENWIELSERLSEIITGSWEILCIIYFYNTSNLVLGKSLMEFIMSQPEEPSVLFLTYCIGLLGCTCREDAAQEELMKKLYDDLMSVTDVLDSFSMEVLSKGLCYTRHYKECESLLAKAKETNPLPTGLLVNTFIGGLRNHNHDLCNDVLNHFEDAVSSATFLQQFPSIVEEALKNENKHGLRMFFTFLNKMGLIPPKHMVESAIESFERYEPGQWQGTFGHIHQITGRCSVCMQSMEELSISDEDFKAVRSAFLDQVIVSDNIFYKSTPKEVQSFISFVAQNGPFDVVIDGLNVLYVNSRSQGQNVVNPYMLSVLESSFSELDLKVLILGNRFLQKKLYKVNKDTCVFGTSTTKADDAFFLYAALHSGKNTLIVSSDKLRDHKFRLEPKLRPIFHRWLKLVQVFDFFIHSTTDVMVLKRQKFNLGPVEDKEGWHLPFDDTSDVRPFGRNGVLCLRQGAENFISDKRHRNKMGWNRNGSNLQNPKSLPKRSEEESIPWFEY